MTRPKNKSESDAHALCIACGLCCTGHLFSWAGLDASEIKKTHSLGMNVIGTDSGIPGFSLPCLHWQGKCTIYYTHADKPVICSSYKCKLLKELKAGQAPLVQVLAKIRRAQAMITELEGLLPASAETNFCTHLIGHIKRLEKLKNQSGADTALRLKSGALLILFDRYFGVSNFSEHPGMMSSDLNDAINTLKDTPTTLASEEG